jgi:hypothetical protein
MVFEAANSLDFGLDFKNPGINSPGMASPPTSTQTVFLPTHGGKWSATMQTPAGPVTAIGDTIGDAQIALDQLLALARAVEVTRRRASDS